MKIRVAEQPSAQPPVTEEQVLQVLQEVSNFLPSLLKPNYINLMQLTLHGEHMKMYCEAMKSHQGVSNSFHSL